MHGLPGSKLHAAATTRNREPILEVLRRVLPRHGTVLEIASGTGEHSVFFAANLPDLHWQPSDLAPECLASVAAWSEESGLRNLLPPVFLDARWDTWPVGKVDAVYTANMIHIAPWEACEGLIGGAAKILAEGGLLVLYGPFKVGGRHTAPSNDRFDQGLRAQDPRWGVRDIEKVEDLACRHGLEWMDTVSMPANNFCVVFRKVQR